MRGRSEPADIPKEVCRNLLADCVLIQCQTGELAFLRFELLLITYTVLPQNLLISLFVIDVPQLGDEADIIPSGAFGEAMPLPGLGVDRKGIIVVIMKRAPAYQVIARAFGALDILAVFRLIVDDIVNVYVHKCPLRFSSAAGLAARRNS